MKRILAITTAALALGGCLALSDQPLFSAQGASRHPLAEGLWALSSVGCEVRPDPTGRMPDCALPLSISAGVMRWDPAAVLTRMLGMPGVAVAKGMRMPMASAVVLADGDPPVLELVNGSTNETPPPPAPAPGKPAPPPRPPLKPGYAAVRPLGYDRSGRVVKAVIWPVVCPPETAHAQGFAYQNGKCVVQTAEAVRLRANAIPALLSYEITWVRADPSLPPSAMGSAPQ